MIASKSGDAILVGELLAHGADPNAENINGGTPIMFAAISGEILTIKSLINAGADVSAQGNNGWSALMVAAAKGHVAATRLIIESGADVNTTDVYLWTPLIRAAYENRRDVVSTLLEHEYMDIHHRDEHGATALHHAANQGNGEIVELLVIHGADPGIRDAQGRTASMTAFEMGHTELGQYLEKAG
jgi:ankyrin repeat protein